jgi:hypothetical protein
MNQLEITISTSVVKHHFNWGGDQLRPKEFNQLRIVKSLEGTDIIKGMIHYPKYTEDLKYTFLLIDRGHSLVRCHFDNRPKWHSYDDSEYWNTASMSRDHHNAQYHLWISALKNIKEIIL